MISQNSNSTAVKAGKLWASVRNDDAIESMTVPEFCRTLARRHDEMFDVPDDRRFDTATVDDQMVTRSAMSNAAISETFSTVIGNKLIEGTNSEPDTTLGWTFETSAVNFLPATLFTLEHGARLERQTKGKPAQHISFGTKGEPWAIARYAGQFVLDEMDMFNGSHVGAIFLAASQQGAAAARVRPDLIYSLLLSNPTLTADNVALFHTTHANKASGGSSALDATSLDAGISAIGLQHLTAEQDSYAIHSNLTAKFLVVPPQLVGAARRAVRNMSLGDGGDLVVLQESRLSAIGVIDPHSRTNYAGTATNWLLTAPAGSRPTIAVGGLDGNLKPQIRRFELGIGQYGVGWDIVLDIGCAALDYRGAYFSLGV